MKGYNTNVVSIVSSNGLNIGLVKLGQCPKRATDFI